LADQAKMDRTYISEIEGADVNPSIEVVAKIATAFDLKPGELLDNDYSSAS
jgi:transcriptional regulator with XRE-family HTH domain